MGEDNRQGFNNEIGLRLKKLFRERALQYKDVSAMLDEQVHYKTISGYCNGTAMPTLWFLRKVAEKLKVSIDWIVRGEGDACLKDEYEIGVLQTFRQARQLGVGEDVKRFADFTVQQKLKGMEPEEPSQERILDLLVISEGLDTVGKRLQYAREVLVGQRAMEMAKVLGISQEELLKIETGEVRPAPTFYTAFFSHYGKHVNLDWLLTGKSGK